MQAGHPHVVQPGDFVAQHLGGEGGLLGHRHVTGAAGGHHDVAQRPPLPGVSDGHLGNGVVLQRDGLRHPLRRIGGQAGNENILTAPFPHGCGDAGDLFRGFARPVNHLRRPLADGAVEVYLGVTQVLKGLPFQPGQSFLRGGGAVGHLAEQL